MCLIKHFLIPKLPRFLLLTLQLIFYQCILYLIIDHNYNTKILYVEHLRLMEFTFSIFKAINNINHFISRMAKFKIIMVKIIKVMLKMFRQMVRLIDIS